MSIERPDHEPVPYGEILASAEEVQAEIGKMAAQLVYDFKDRDPLFVALYRGALPFSSALMREIATRDPLFHPEMDLMTVSRYGAKHTGGLPEIVMDLSPKTVCSDRPVILLDDMVDRGVTLNFTAEHLRGRGAEEIYTAVLVQRETPECLLDADYSCFRFATDVWLTGMGLDNPHVGREANRWAPFIAEAK